MRVLALRSHRILPKDIHDQPRQPVALAVDQAVPSRHPGGRQAHAAAGGSGGGEAP